MSLKSIQPDTADNLEGLQAIYFIPAPFVTGIPEATDNVISDDISLASGKKWLSLYVTLNSADYNEEKQRNEHGVFYEKELTGFLPKDSPGIAAQLEEMENYRFHVIYRDRNDHYKLVQDLEFKHEFSTDGRNGFEITFEGSGVKPGYFYIGKIEEETETIEPILTRKNPNTQTYTFTFEANSSKYNAQTIECSGTIQQIDSPVSYTLNKLTSSSPFKQQLQAGDSVSKGDIIEIELDSEPASQVKVEVVVSYTDESYTKTVPDDLGGNGEYYFILSPADQIIKVFEIPSRTVNDTITSLPSGKNFNVIAYRYQNKSFYVFGDSYVAIIDGDPSNGTFKNVTNHFSLGSLGSDYRAVAHDFDDDLIYCYVNTGVTSDGVIFNPVANTASEAVVGQDFYGRGFFGFKSGYNYISQYGIIWMKYVVFYIRRSIISQVPSGIQDKGVFYNPYNGLIYMNGDGPHKVSGIGVNSDGYLEEKLAISENVSYGGAAYDYNNNILLTFESSGEEVDKFDLNTNTRVDSGQFETASGSDAIVMRYSPVDGMVYVVDYGLARVVVLDPTKAVANMKVTDISLSGFTKGQTPRMNFAAMNKIKYY